MNRSTLEGYEQLARGLVWAGGVVLILAIFGAILIAGSDNGLGVVAPEAEREGRGIFALASLGIGLAMAGLMSGLGAILRLMVAERLEKLGPSPVVKESETKTGAKLAREQRRPPARRSRRDDSDEDGDPEPDDR